jgi:hypothetical protein
MTASSDHGFLETLEMSLQVWGDIQIAASIGRHDEKLRDSKALSVQSK